MRKLLIISFFLPVMAWGLGDRRAVSTFSTNARHQAGLNEGEHPVKQFRLRSVKNQTVGLLLEPGFCTGALIKGLAPRVLQPINGDRCWG